MTTFSSRTLAVIAALALFVSACGSDDSEAATAADDTETTTSTAAPTTTAAMEDAVDEESMDEESTDEAMSEDASDASTDAADDSSAVGETEPSAARTELEQILPFFGITDSQAAADCVEDEAQNDGTTVDAIMAGDGSPMMVAVVRCRPDEVRDSLAVEFSDIDSSSIAATPAQIECSFDSMLDYIAGIDLLEAEGVLEGDAPQDLVDKLADDCAISTSDAEFLLNEA